MPLTQYIPLCLSANVAKYKAFGCLIEFLPSRAHSHAFSIGITCYTKLVFLLCCVLYILHVPYGFL